MKRPLSRISAVLGSVLIGLVGAVAVGTPAQAHHTTISGNGQCVDGGILITWTVQNWETEMTAQLKQVTTSDPAPVTGIAVDATLPGSTKSGKNWNYGQLVGTQLVPDGTTSASLEVKARWSNGVQATNKGFATNLRSLKCDRGDYTGEVTGSAYCETETGTWKVSWTVANKHADKAAKVEILTPDTLDGLATGDSIAAASSVVASQTVAGSETSATLKVKLTWGHKKEHVSEQTVQFEGTCVKDAPKPDVQFSSDCTGFVTVTLSNGADATKAAVFVVTGAGGFSSGEITIGAGEPQVQVVVPAENSSAVTVTEAGETVAEYSWKDSTECHPVEGDVVDTCDGLVFKLTNPEGGAEATFVLTPSVGDKIEVTLAPGETKEIKVDAVGDTLSVDVSDGVDTITVDWEKPEGCDEPGLPVTGTQVTMIVTAGVVLLGAGAALFLLARRRRITLE